MNSEIVSTILIACITSSGFWLIIQKVIDELFERGKASKVDDMLLIGLAHDRIHTLASSYISRGWLTSDEYENLEKYLYKPYKAMGGNGTGERLMEEVKKLPLRGVNYA